MKCRRWQCDGDTITIQQIAEVMRISFDKLMSTYNIYEDLSEPHIALEVCEALATRSRAGHALGVICTDDEALVAVNFLAWDVQTVGGYAVGFGPLAVLPSHQGRGITKLFWSWLYSQQEWRTQWKIITLVVDSHNVAAYSSYLKHGAVVPQQTYCLLHGKKLLVPVGYTCSVSHHLDNTCTHHPYCAVLDMMILECRTAAAVVLNGEARIDVNDEGVSIWNANNSATLLPMIESDLMECSRLSGPARGVVRITANIGAHGWDKPRVLFQDGAIIAYTTGFNLDGHTYAVDEAAFQLLFCSITLMNWSAGDTTVPWVHMPLTGHSALLQWGSRLLDVCKLTVQMSTDCDASCGCYTCVRKTVRSDVLIPTFGI